MVKSAYHFLFPDLRRKAFIEYGGSCGFFTDAVGRFVCVLSGIVYSYIRKYINITFSLYTLSAPCIFQLKIYLGDLSKLVLKEFLHLNKNGCLVFSLQGHTIIYLISPLLKDNLTLSSVGPMNSKSAIIYLIPNIYLTSTIV